MESLGNIRLKVIQYLGIGLSLFFVSLAVEAGTIDYAAFCVTDTEMQFSIDITSVNVDTPDVRLAAFAQEAWLSGSPREYFGLNMDRDCQVTRGNYPEVGELDGPVSLDRFQNGLISNYTLTKLGDGQCRFSGYIIHGADPYSAGETIADVFFREFNPYADAHTLDVVITDVVEDCEDDIVVVPPTPATPVPTLSQWVLIMLSMVLGLMVFANRRHLF